MNPESKLIVNISPSSGSSPNSYILFSPDLQQMVDDEFSSFFEIEFFQKEVKILNDGYIKYSFNVSVEKSKMLEEIVQRQISEEIINHIPINPN